MAAASSSSSGMRAAEADQSGDEAEFMSAGSVSDPGGGPGPGGGVDHYDIGDDSEDDDPVRAPQPESGAVPKQGSMRAGEIGSQVVGDAYTTLSSDYRQDQLPLRSTLGIAAPQNPFARVSDDVIGLLPAVFVSHVLSTIGNEGHQVLDGRTTSLAGMVRKVTDPLRAADSMIVGRGLVPTTFPTLFQYDEPLSFFGSVPVLSSLSAAEMSSASTAQIHVPMPADLTSRQKRLVKAVAVISVMMRSDVAGDAERLAKMYGEMRGVSADTLLRCARASPMLSADLEAVFLSSDDVKPQVLAPTSVRRAVSVAASAGGRTIFGPDVLVDYQRARVAASAAYVMAMDFESASWATPSTAPGRVVQWTPESGTLHYRIYPGTQKRFRASYFALTLGKQPVFPYAELMTDEDVDHFAQAFAVNTSLFEPKSASVRQKPAGAVSSAEYNAVVEAIESITRAAVKNDPSVRVSKVAYLIGIALDAAVDKLYALFPAVLAWIRSVELAGLVLARAGSVPPALPWALALGCAATASGFAATVFEAFVRTADLNDISIDAVMDTVMAYVPGRLPRQFQGTNAMHARFMAGLSFTLIRFTTDRPAELTYVRGLKPHQLAEGVAEDVRGWRAKGGLMEEGDQRVRVHTIECSHVPDDEFSSSGLTWQVAPFDEDADVDQLRVSVAALKKREVRTRAQIVEDALGSVEAQALAEDLGYTFLSSKRSPFFEWKSGGRFRPRTGPVTDPTQTRPGRVARRLSTRMRNMFMGAVMRPVKLSAGASLRTVLEGVASTTTASTKAYITTAYTSRETVFSTVAASLPDGDTKTAMSAATAVAVFMRKAVQTMKVEVVVTDAESTLVTIVPSVFSDTTETADAGVARVVYECDTAKKNGWNAIVCTYDLEQMAAAFTELIAKVPFISVVRAGAGTTSVQPPSSAAAAAPEPAGKGGKKPKQAAAAPKKAVWVPVTPATALDVRHQMRTASCTATGPLLVALARASASLGRSMAGLTCPQELIASLKYDEEQVLSAVAFSLNSAFAVQMDRGGWLGASSPAAVAATAAARAYKAVTDVEGRGEVVVAAAAALGYVETRDENSIREATKKNLETLPRTQVGAVPVNKAPFDGVALHSFYELASHAATFDASLPALLARPEPYGQQATDYAKETALDADEDDALSAAVFKGRWPKWSLAWAEIDAMREPPAAQAAFSASANAVG